MRRGRFRGPGCEFSGIYENKNYPRKQTVFTAESLAKFPARDRGVIARVHVGHVFLWHSLPCRARYAFGSAIGLCRELLQHPAERIGPVLAASMATFLHIGLLGAVALFLWSALRSLGRLRGVLERASDSTQCQWSPTASAESDGSRGTVIHAELTTQ
jgi:hypothetical protein